MPNRFSVERSEIRPGCQLFELGGELDLAVAEQLQTALASVSPGDLVLVDLSSCEFIDSTGLAVLIQAHDRQSSGGGRLAAYGAGAQVGRIMSLTGLTANGLVFATREDALAG